MIQSHKLMNCFNLLLLVASVLFFTCDDPFSADDQEMGVDFDTIRGYYLSQQAPLQEGSNYYIVLDQSLWTILFLPKLFPYDQSAIENINFQTHLVISIIKYGNATWEMAADSVAIEGSRLKFHYYASPVTEDLNGSLATSLIIQIPRIRFTSVQFYENEALAHEVKNLSFE